MTASRIVVARWPALAGSALALPFLALNAVVTVRMEPLFSTIRPGAHAGPFEYPLLATAPMLLPLGAVIALSPLLRTGRDGGRLFPVANILVAAVLIVGFLAIGIAFGEELYRCEVLGIPNCD